MDTSRTKMRELEKGEKKPRGVPIMKVDELVYFKGWAWRFRGLDDEGMVVLEPQGPDPVAKKPGRARARKGRRR